MVPATSEDIQGEYRILLRELEKYNPELLGKARILAISKMDVPRVDEEGNELPKIDFDALQKALEIPIIPISSLTNEGIDELKDQLWTELNKEQNQVIEISHAPIRDPDRERGTRGARRRRGANHLSQRGRRGMGPRQI